MNLSLLAPSCSFQLRSSVFTLNWEKSERITTIDYKCIYLVLLASPFPSVHLAIVPIHVQLLQPFLLPFDRLRHLALTTVPFASPGSSRRPRDRGEYELIRVLIPSCYIVALPVYIILYCQFSLLLSLLLPPLSLRCCSPLQGRMEAQTAESSACCFCQLPVNLTYEKGVSWVGPVDMVLPSTDSRPSLPSPLYAHASCTKWHDQILLDEDGYVDDFNELKRIITRSQRELCDHCSESGSTLRCSVPHCSWRSHYPCAKIQQATFVGSFQKIFCKKHKHLAAEVEISEQSYFLVERILSHRDVPTGVEGKLLREYLVKWQGYDALEDATCRIHSST